jgi:hypothetical protein
MMMIATRKISPTKDWLLEKPRVCWIPNMPWVKTELYGLMGIISVIESMIAIPKNPVSRVRNRKKWARFKSIPLEACLERARTLLEYGKDPDERNRYQKER